MTDRVISGLTNNKPMLGAIAFAGILFVLWGMLCEPLRHHFLVKQNIENIKKKVGLTKELNMERQILLQESQSTIELAHKEFESKNESKLTGIWLGYYLTQCGVSHFSFSEDSKVPLGGHGRPIFSVITSLHYSQALCFLDYLSRHSSDKKLTEMKLRRENNSPLLTLKLEMEIMR